MRISLMLSAAVCLCGVSHSPALAQDVLFAQPHLTIDDPLGLSFQYSNQLPTHPEELDDARSRAFDNFSLSAPVDVTEIRFSGSFDGPFKPQSPRTPLDFWIEIFPDNGAGQPLLDDVLVSRILDAGQAGTDDGVEVRSQERSDDVGARDASVVDYRTQNLEPVRLDSGDYWMSIVAIQTFPNPDPFEDPVNGFFDPAWGWHFGGSGRDGDGSFAFDAIRASEEPGAQSPYDLSFSLMGSEVVVVTLPGDFDGNSLVDADDIDLLAARLREGTSDPTFDLNMDGSVNRQDLTTLVEETIGTFAGDANLDRAVNVSDFLILSRNFNGAGGWGQGDFDGSGTVAVQDFLQLSQNFNRTTSAIVAVPEPAAGHGLFLAVAGLVLGGRVRRR